MERFVHATKGEKYFTKEVAKQKDLLARRGWYPDPIKGTAKAEDKPKAEPAKEPVKEEVKTPVAKSSEESIDELKARYKELYGKKPHYKWSAERIQEQIDAKQ